MVKYGSVIYQGVEYSLTGMADYTNRLLDGRYTNYNDASEGETYDAEFSASAVDPNGNESIVYWMQQFVKGSEPEDLSDLSWDEPNRVVGSN